MEAGGIGLQKPRLWPWPPREVSLFAQKAPSLSFCTAKMIRMQAETAGGAVPQDPQSIPLMACFLQRNQMQKQLIASQRSSALSLSLQLSSACIQDSALVVPVELVANWLRQVATMWQLASRCVQQHVGVNLLPGLRFDR